MWRAEIGNELHLEAELIWLHAAADLLQIKKRFHPTYELLIGTHSVRIYLSGRFMKLKLILFYILNKRGMNISLKLRQ